MSLPSYNMKKNPKLLFTVIDVVKETIALFLLSQSFLNLTGLNLHVIVIQRKVLTAESYVAILKRYKKQ